MHQNHSVVKHNTTISHCTFINQAILFQTQ